MIPFYQDNHIELYAKDCRQMTELANESVQIVVTSPPYWGLRKYSGEQELIWGIKTNPDGTHELCKHEWDAEIVRRDRGKAVHSDVVGQPRELIGTTTPQGKFCSLCGAWKGAYGLEPTPEMYVQHTIEILREIRRVLRKDGVVFWNIGDSYSGSWGNSGSRAGGQRPQSVDRFDRPGYDNYKERPSSSYKHSIIKPKDLCLIPFRIALAAQEGWHLIPNDADRGWLAGIIDGEGCIGIRLYQRKDKRYPEVQPFIQVGVNDIAVVEKCQRLTRLGRRKDREREGRHTLWTWYVEGEDVVQVLGEVYPHLAIKQKQACIVAELLRSKAIRGSKHHPQNDELIASRYRLWREIKACNQRRAIDISYKPPARINESWYVRSVIVWSKNNPMPESVKDRPTESHEYILLLTKNSRYYWDADAVREPVLPDSYRTYRPMTSGAMAQESHFTDGQPQGRTCGVSEGGRNIRTVWEFPTQPYPEAHFAVFPEKLPELCIKAATPEVGCCSKCGAPWERVLDKKPSEFNIRVRDAKAGRATPEEGYKATQEEINGYPGNHPDPGYRETIGWQPTCKCEADKVPSIVLDPFAGAGTTLWVAKKLNRRAVGYEISEEYCELALERNRQQVMM